MMRQWLGAFAAATMTTAVLGAQAQQPANTPPPDAGAPAGIQRTAPAPSAQTKANAATFTGCIEDSPMVTAAVTAPASTPSATKMYYLNNAKMATDAGAPRSNPVGTSGAAATGYRLEGDTALLSQHLNQQVRIVGTVQSSNASPTGAANAAPGSTAAGPTLKVDSVTMVAAKCEDAK